MGSVNQTVAAPGDYNLDLRNSDYEKAPGEYTISLYWSKEKGTIDIEGALGND